MAERFLYEKYDTLSEYGALPKEIPESILTNLNPAFELREYQKEALKRFFHYFLDAKNRIKPTQLLFHMATGSGKTLIMAAIILYLYEKGYRNYIFFVNSTNIIEKTRDNFLNPLSPKLLFDERVKFGTKRVTIKEVENFESVNENDISILFTTIQGLHSRLNTPRENSLTYEDFQGKKIAMLSDEAHHINALTKRSLTISEQEEMQTWEATVNRIFRANQDNLLLEFTATVELGHPAVMQKYEDKIIFEYSLRKFREDGFSKDVKVLQTDLEPLDRALQAILVSQYRRKVAEQHKLRVKPVLLLKSKTIPDSKEIEGRFHQLVANLKRKDVERIKNNAKSDVVQKAFLYFEKDQIVLDNLVEELKVDFAEEKCITINSKDESIEKQILVNSLESKNNEIRVVFVVDMLNEGWDVLNLFDIVRLYETRDAKSGQPGGTTISEAQLIGRGARYFPFQLTADQDKYKRKFDLDLNNELRILEELHYHSSYNPKYIQELRTALIQTGIWPSRARTIQVRVKDEIKQHYTEVYLLRNENLFQLYRFSDGAAIEPDFVLFLKEEGKKYVMYQLFVEAKGDRGLIEDKWKEEFILQIENEYKIEVLFENREFKLLGMPFYNENFKSQFETVFTEKVL